jgi:ferric-dicitrate binding protein FerR (iron transport regulator)
MHAFAATHPVTPGAEVGYQPGVCNIGPAEIRRRRWTGHIGLVAALVLLAVLLVIDAPPLARLLVAIPAMLSASGYLQAWLKFCAGFAQIGVYNFGDRGEMQKVVDPEAHRRDLARGRRIGLGAAAIGAAVALAAVLLPI